MDDEGDGMMGKMRSIFIKLDPILSYPSLTSYLKFFLEFPSLRVSQFHSFPVSSSEPLLQTSCFPVSELLQTSYFPVLTVSQFTQTGKL